MAEREELGHDRAGGCEGEGNGQDQASMLSKKLVGRRSWDVHPSLHTVPLPSADSAQRTTRVQVNAGSLLDEHPSHVGCGSKDAGGRLVVNANAVSTLSKGTTSRARRAETPEQRARRLARQAKYNQRRRRATEVHVDGSGVSEANKESVEDMNERLARQRERNKQRRREAKATPGGESTSAIEPSESLEHRQVRLARQHEYVRNRRKRAPETSPPTQPATQEIGNHTLVKTRDGSAEEVSLGESATQREERLAWQRNYAKRRRQHASTSVGHFGMLDVVDETVVSAIESKLRDAMGADGLDECVCAVCDRLVLRKITNITNEDSSVFHAIQERLTTPSDIPALLATQYSCGDVHVSLQKLLLSRKGVRVAPSGVELLVCAECLESLSKDTADPPKFAIANGFFVGRLPDELSEATWIETIMTQLVTVVAQTRIMRGGRHRAIRSHCMVFDATPGPPATLLPRRVDRNGPYSVVLAGPLTATQTDTIRKLHRARGQVVQALLQNAQSVL